MALQLSQPTETIGYPTQHMLGIFEDQAQINALAQEAQGIASQGWVASGQDGLDQFRADSDKEGLLAAVARLAQGMTEKHSQFLHYEEALKGGKFVVALKLDTPDKDKAEAARLFQAHGGHFLHYMGETSWEQLDTVSA